MSKECFCSLDQLADPAAARATSALSLCGAQAFFLTAMPCRAKNRTARRGFQEFRKDLMGGVLLRWRSASAAWHWFASPVLCENVHPPDCGTDAALELFSRFTAGTSCFNKADDRPSQGTRIGSMHWVIPTRINVTRPTPAPGIRIRSRPDML
jgi:hypothetical protein